MIQGFYTAAGSMVAQQKRLDIIAGNIANVDTEGYKKSSPEFAEVVYSAYQNMNSAGAVSNYNIGNGVMVTGESRDASSGTTLNTGSSLDISVSETVTSRWGQRGEPLLFPRR